MKLAHLFFAATMSVGAALSSVAPAAAMPVDRPAVSAQGDIVQIRDGWRRDRDGDDRGWRDERDDRGWRHQRDWRRSDWRDDDWRWRRWRAERWQERREWRHRDRDMPFWLYRG
ncbi:hypothetical protein CO657_06590 [Rhizobium acidisoli]|uniref:Uncharacterized protein n=1 Tax=Rhizobium acidisoli TaxID=1538158 RepID=A0AAE5WM28_9HYPH|nr:hypothetical protein [Rhizobium acidisoli]KPH10835.1 hypothetical protein AOG23_04475 [Rhizobium acidisoli]QAS77765.1 hypothetical protein CO657_06590 [Rhizobium acidisoli]